MDEQGHPVLIDPVTGYHIVGHKGEDLATFLKHVTDVVI